MAFSNTMPASSSALSKYDTNVQKDTDCGRSMKVEMSESNFGTEPNLLKSSDIGLFRTPRQAIKLQAYTGKSAFERVLPKDYEPPIIIEHIEPETVDNKLDRIFEAVPSLITSYEEIFKIK